MNIKINKISKQEVWPMRHKIMYPDYPFETIKLPKDDEGLHYGLFVNKKLVSVVSLFIIENKAQFRKLATEVEEQGKGYGTQLLNFIFEKVETLNVLSIWCNSRVNKANFYRKFGMIKTDKLYNKYGIDYVIMEKLFKIEH